ncbi:MAG: HAD-IIIC family phosphatase [Bryobacteraceae bacterium]
MPQEDLSITICATFTAEALEPVLNFWVSELGLGCPIRFAGYGQVFQQLLDPNSLLAANHGYNLVLVRLEDWREAGMADSAARLAEALRGAAARFHAPLLVAICPSGAGCAQAARAVEQSLADALAGTSGVSLLLPADVAALYPVAEIHDPHADELGHLPYTPLYFAALATAAARRIHALAAPPFKLVALDCDDTLWAGICGEDGPAGVNLDEPRRGLQEFFAERKRQGMLLALVSKNNEEDVLETFRAHPEMPLALEDFVARRVNWEPKSANLASLAVDLALGLDSFILVDDNPKECREAQAARPEVLAVSLPSDPRDIPAFLDHVWAFDRAAVTTEDLRRSELYHLEARRAAVRRSVASLDDFLASLRLAIDIGPLTSTQVSRVAQLTQRTNQMNTSLIRRTESEIRTMPEECLTVSVRDRFGDYGLTGVAIFRVERGSLVVDTMLFSCRVLGRGVEQRVLAHLGQLARRRGLDSIAIPLRKGPRNRPAELFLNSIGAAADGVYRLSPHQIDAALAAGSRKAVPAHPVTPAVEAPVAAGNGADANGRPDYVRIATELANAEAILHHARNAARPAVARRRASAIAPRTPLETQLAALWAELLNLPSAGVNENFFELGGHSLLAVQLLSRVRQIFGVDLSLEVVYSGDFTVAELAKAVELKEIEQSGASYQDLLRELEGMSDEEARALLAEEQAQE